MPTSRSSDRAFIAQRSRSQASTATMKSGAVMLLQGVLALPLLEHHKFWNDHSKHLTYARSCCKHCQHRCCPTYRRWHRLRRVSVSQQAQAKQRHAHIQPVRRLSKVRCSRVGVHLCGDLVHSWQWMHQHRMRLELCAERFVDDELAFALVVKLWPILQAANNSHSACKLGTRSLAPPTGSTPLCHMA
jgi:hypothetical protein